MFIIIFIYIYIERERERERERNLMKKEVRELGDSNLDSCSWGDRTISIEPQKFKFDVHFYVLLNMHLNSTHFLNILLMKK